MEIKNIGFGGCWYEGKYEIFHHQNMLVGGPNWLVCIYNFSSFISFLLKSTPPPTPKEANKLPL